MKIREKKKNKEWYLPGRPKPLPGDRTPSGFQEVEGAEVRRGALARRHPTMSRGVSTGRSHDDDAASRGPVVKQLCNVLR